MKWSKYQEGIFKAIEETDDNIIVEAVAGSGKSTTILESINRININYKTLLCAFNKDIVEDIKPKINNHNVDVKTMHSVGLGLGRKDYPVLLQEGIFNKVKEVCYESNADINKWHLTIKINKLIEYIKNNYLQDDINKAIESCEIDFKHVSNDTIINICNKVLDYNKDKILTFEDMIWIPTINKMRLNQYDYIFVDEAQDLNPLQLNFILNCFNSSSRKVFVGDRKQAIYAFRGAMTDSIDKLKSRFNCKEYPLNVCYRCPVKVIKEAQKLVPNIEGFKTEEGKVFSIDIENDYSPLLNNIKAGDLVLSRNNKDMFKLLLELILLNKKGYIKGSNITPKKLMDLYKEFGKELYHIKRGLSQNIIELNRELKILENNNKYDRINKLQNQIDFRETALLIAGHCRDYDDLEVTVDNYFKPNNGTVISTIHKAKGLEEDNVWILNYDKIPSKFAVSDSDIQQELNLLYVAITRAKKKLIKVEGFGKNE